MQVITITSLNRDHRSADPFTARYGHRLRAFTAIAPTATTVYIRRTRRKLELRVGVGDMGIQREWTSKAPYPFLPEPDRRA